MLARSTYCTVAGACPAAGGVPSVTATRTPGPVTATSPAAIRSSSSSCARAWSALRRCAAADSNSVSRWVSAATCASSPRRVSRSCPSIVARACTLRVGTPSCPESIRPARSCTVTRKPRAINSNVSSACHRTARLRSTSRADAIDRPDAAAPCDPAALLLPDIPLAENLLQLLLDLDAVPQADLHGDHVLAGVRDDVSAHRPRAAVRFEVLAELLDLLACRDPHAECGTCGVGGLGSGRGRGPPVRRTGVAVRPHTLRSAPGRAAVAVPVAARPGGRHGHLELHRLLGRGRQGDDLLAQELGPLLFEVHLAPQQHHGVPLERKPLL